MQTCRRFAARAIVTRLLSVAIALLGPSGVAHAHVSERAYVLLLPTRLYLVGGALVVALSFALMALVPMAGVQALARARRRVANLPGWIETGPSLVAFALAVALTIAGFAGSLDPLGNPLPLTVWTLWWVGFTFCHALFGNLWGVLNPWRGPYRLMTAAPGLRRWRARPPLRYPRWLGFWPAVATFFGFAWFELVSPAPQDPAGLATVVALYMGATFVAMTLFGESAWLRQGEAFSVFFRIVAWLSPFERRRPGAAGTSVLFARVPGMGLVAAGILPPSAMVFVLLALASVSFDGLSRTFWWVDLVGGNPLEFPGRTVLVGANTLGLVATFLALAAAFVAAVLLGRAVARPASGIGESLGRFVVSIVPIAFGYHFAHYLPAFLVDGQYAVRALSDPFALGWDLLATGDLHVAVSLVTSHDSVRLIWNLQVVGIVTAHVVAVAIAHVLALQDAAGARRAVLGQAPMTGLMIAYTLFGLWLLATPVVG